MWATNSGTIQRLLDCLFHGSFMIVHEKSLQKQYGYLTRMIKCYFETKIFEDSRLQQAEMFKIKSL
jgi:hypothetical protein